MTAKYTRRASYGPASQAVGERGARTRTQVVAAALTCFTEKGFHDTAVEDIASVAKVSRATLYQYFASKEAVFIELMSEAGASLMSSTRKLGPLGATADGFDNLYLWLADFGASFDLYSAMFIEWANVNSPKAPLRPRLVSLIEAHTDRFAPALVKAGFQGCCPETMSILLLSVTNRFNYIRHVYRPGLTDAQLLISIAVAAQLTLFPDTPRAVLDAGPPSAERPEGNGVSAPPVPTMGPLASLPPRSEIPVIAPFEGLSDQAARTVRQLLDAASRVFADTGYDAANIDQIVTSAGLARGTFYRYFDEKLELMAALANECAADMRRPFRELARFSDRPDPEGLKRWLHDFLLLQQRYSGVMRAWTEGFPVDPTVLGPCRDTIIDIGAAVRETFGPRRSYPMQRRAVGMMFAGLLEQFPNEGRDTKYEWAADEIVRAQALFVQRVLLAR